jgi:hypothetical protein
LTASARRRVLTTSIMKTMRVEQPLFITDKIEADGDEDSHITDEEEDEEELEEHEDDEDEDNDDDEDEDNEDDEDKDDSDDDEVDNSRKVTARNRNLDFEPRERRYELVQSKSKAKRVVAEFYGQTLGMKYGKKVAAELQKLDEEVYTTSELDSEKPKKRRRK